MYVWMRATGMKIPVVETEESHPGAVGFAHSSRIIALTRQGLVIYQPEHELAPYVKIGYRFELQLRPDKISLDWTT